MKKFALWILTTLLLCFWAIFADNILPDGVEIEVKSPVIQWEATNLKITMMKDGAKMSSYVGTIWMEIVDEDWNSTIWDNEYKLPNNWWYSFLESDLWSKEFQRWLEIKKEWTFYIKVSDLEDNEFWKQKIQVVKWDWELWNKHIDVLSPTQWANLINEKVEIIWNVTDLRNSSILIYIDWEYVATTNSDWDGLINHALSNIEVWPHSLTLQAVDYQWNILGTSDKIYFTYTPQETTWLKDVVVNPELWLMIWDTVDITVYTDEMVEAVKILLSDRESNDSIIVPRVWNWEFSIKQFIMWTGDITITVETSASNNSEIKTYKDAKTIHVSDIPAISDVVVDQNDETQVANISRWIINGSVDSYIVTYWLGSLTGSDSSAQKTTDSNSFVFTDVPYDTEVFFTVTPVIDSNRHWAASETITFIMTKPNKNICWNWIADPDETCSNCPQDLWSICDTWATTNTCWNGITDPGETCSSCPQDLWNICNISSDSNQPKCTVQNIATRTTKIGDSYYLIRDKVENVSKYIVYSSTTENGSDKVKVYETTDTSYEYPFDHTLEEDKFAYFWIVWVCDDWEVLQLSGATKVQVWPAENFFLLMCLTFLIYFWIKLFRQTEV